jgi:Uma2 family endonuclease
MAEPAWKTPTATDWAPERETPEDPEERSVLQRWVELPDGRIELLELPLTPELYLDPELEDKMVQGEWHDLVCWEISGLLRHHFRREYPQTRVFHDLKHLFGHGLSAPSPDVSVVRGFHHAEPLDSLDVEREGVRPSLVVEVVSPLSARVRQTDLKDKVKLYRRAGIPEYVIVDCPRRRAGRRYTLLGYRLDAEGQYQPLALDDQGRLLAETIGIWFQVAPTGDQVFLFDAATGQRLLNLDEQAERIAREEEKAAREKERANREKERADREARARKAAERKAAREVEARKAAEAEITRLRAEIERLR